METFCPAMRRRQGTGLLVAVLAVGLLLRFCGLGSQSIWEDEAYSVEIASQAPSALIAETARRDFNPPLYYLVLHGALRLFGRSEFCVRLPSAVFGFLCLVALYAVGRATLGRRAAVVATLVLAVSAFHIIYSQEARAYSLMSLLSLVSVCFFWRLLCRADAASSVGYVLASALLLYTHYYGIFVLAAQNLYLLLLALLPRDARALTARRWLALQGAVMLLFAPWLPALAGQLRRQQSGCWIPSPTAASLTHTLRSYAGYSRAMLLALILLAFAACVKWTRRSGRIELRRLFRSAEAMRWEVRLADTRAVCFLWLWFLTPILVPFAASQFMTSLYLARYTIASCAAFYLLAAGGLARFDARTGAVLTGVVVALALPAVVGWQRAAGSETGHARRRR